MGLKGRTSIHPHVSPLSLRGAAENRAHLVKRLAAVPVGSANLFVGLWEAFGGRLSLPVRRPWALCFVRIQPWICVIALFVVTTPIPLSCSCNSERVTNVVLLRLFVLLRYHVGKSLARIHPRGPSRDIIVSNKSKCSVLRFDTRPH